jgi:putative heme-binding domain-containing protein
MKPIALFALLLLALPAWAAQKHPFVSAPEGFDVTEFSTQEITPTVASLGVGLDGSVYAGVDGTGSLGKGPGKGKIVKLVDTDNDGKADSHTDFCVVDNPRGILPVGNALFVLHATWTGPKTLQGMYLTRFEDANGDGKADGPGKILVKDFGTLKFNESRGIDHATNGIRMGIDGWIYVAIGDFGFVNATGTDGTQLTMYGGGVARVRPDGTELETYCHGLRNIYDISIDPRMNMFTRGNTNDGGGWNVRFIHEIQSGEYGYPVLYKRYTNEMIPALIDVGGGSGTGSMFFQEPGWPAEYNNVPMMCDWGRSQLIIHRVTPDGPTFTQEPETFIKCPKITDVDSDGSSRLFLGSWHKSGYKGGDTGFVARVTPVDWTYKPAPVLTKASDAELAGLLTSQSSKTRLHAQQALVARGPSTDRTRLLQTLAADGNADVEHRIAAIFGLKQLDGAKAHPTLLGLLADSAVREWAIRAVADRLPQNAGIQIGPLTGALTDSNPRVQVAAAVALGRIANKAAAPALLAAAKPIESHWQSPTPKPKEEKKTPGFVSPVLKGNKVGTAKVDVTGFKKLYLVTDDGGDGNGNDHIAWFDPTLIMADGSEMPLTDLKWASAKGGWGKTLVGKNCQGKSLKRPGIGTHSNSEIIYELPVDALRFETAFGSTNGRASSRYYISDGPVTLKKGGGKVAEGPHATPNSSIVLPHLATQALVAMQADEACLAAIGGPQTEAALWALRYRYTEPVVDGLIAALSRVDDATKPHVAYSLVRLIHREKPYEGDTWWGTRPDTRGPFYYPTAWDQSDKIKTALAAAYQSGNDELQQAIEMLTEKDRAPIEGLTKIAKSAKAVEEPKVDLNAIKNQKGQIGKMAVEDVLLAFDTVKGNSKKGRELFTRQGCIACHTLDKSEPPKGPFMGQVGSILSLEQIATSILRPNAEISQGFKTVAITTKSGAVHSGFVTKRLSDQIELRNIAGIVSTIKAADVKEETLLPTSMMPPGLANGMSIEEFVSLVRFLASQK